jgi:hypothetical protein
MMSDAPGAINFTMFLTLFGERLQGTDPEDVIRNAFGCFDEENQVGLGPLPFPEAKNIENIFSPKTLRKNWQV